MFKNKIFISYAKEDQNFAEKLYSDLKDQGFNLWMDKNNLVPGQNWKIEISKAINESTFFLALISSNSISKAGFTQKELKQAIDILDAYPKSDIFIIPVRIDDCKPIDEKLQLLHWADLFPSYEKGLKEIIRVLKPDSNIKPNMPWKRESNDIKNHRDLKIKSTWANGSFYLFSFLSIIILLGAFASDISFYVLGIVIVIGIFVVSLIGVYQLRYDDLLVDKHFSELIKIVISQLPLLNMLLRKDKK